jgi:type I restriction enzyme S subunit
MNMRESPPNEIDEGALPDGWRTVALGKLAENLDSKRIPVKNSARRPGPYPYYGASGIVDSVEGYLFEGEHLLVADAAFFS